jgi:cephalosporin hydroxylase
MKSEIKKFFKERSKDVSKMIKDKAFFNLSRKWLARSIYYKYNYNYTWLGRPIIKYPDDIIVMQELLWKLKPDLVIETGIAHGGSIVFTASMLKMMDVKNFKVIGIDIDIRKHNLDEIKKSPVYKNLELHEGSSIDLKIIHKIKKNIKKYKKVLVILDSNHSHNHVLQELNLYSKFVTKNSYLILPDTYIDFMPKNTFQKWEKGNNTYTAMKEFLRKNKNFKIDYQINKKSLISEAIEGYLKRIK